MFPLSMAPSDAQHSSQQFDSFVNAIFNPLMSDNTVSEPASEGVQYEVERVVAVKQKGGSTWYKIKWKGYNNKYNVWRPESELDCGELIADFESGRVSGSTASGAIANLL